MDGVRRAERVHRTWSPIQEGLAVTTAVLWAVFPAAPVMVWAAPTAGILLFYFIAGRGKCVNPANLVSLSRIVCTAAAFFLQSFLLDRWIALVVILASAEILDWVDGRLAQRLGPTRFGGLFDEEADAYFMLTVSALLVRTDLFGAWVLSFGLLRYIFTMIFEVFPDRIQFPRGFSRFAKTVCGVSAGVLIASFGRILPPTLRLAAAGAALGLLAFSFLWETVLRFRPLVPLIRAGGLFKSYAVYYLIPGKRYRMRSLYGEFLGEGDLAFDVGAHLGNRIRVWREMGARVVAVEPNPECVTFISYLYGPDEGVEIIPAASGAKPGQGRLFVDPRNPTLATVSARWIKEVEGSELFSNVQWKREHPVSIVTLDELVRTYGTPRFIKVDTEGFDHRVLDGLSVPIPGLSFEYLPASTEIAEEALLKVGSLGDYEFNSSPRETMRFRWREWQSGGEILSFLASLSPGDRAGDIYARLRTTG